MKKEGKKEKGISLIVLIITIVVIIILATAVILSVSNNIPIKRAKEATETHNESVLKESAAILSAQWKTDRLLNKTTKSRSEYVKEGLASQGFTNEEMDDIVISEKTGRVGKKGGAIDIASNPSKYYGATVTNYEESSGSEVGWKIFYSDEINIYLIADDYILPSCIPANALGHKPEEIIGYVYSGDFTHDVGFTNIVNDYMGSDSISDSKLQNLNSAYYNYLKLNNISSKNVNMKAVAYMLDTDAWKVFKGDNAEYAIGGPTSELFIKSYNDKYPSSALEYQVADFDRYKGSNGYTYRNGSSESWNVGLESVFSIDDPLYVIEKNTKAGAMWLATPSIRMTGNLNYIEGRIFIR